MSSGPVIGVTTYREQARWGVWDIPAVLLPAGYVDSVGRAGGVAVLLPPVPDVASVVARLDGVVLAGGADIDPARYGSQPHPETAAPRPDRDTAELAVIAAARAAGVPLLAVCRGMQLLNVEAGGTLHQHVPERVDHVEHNPAPGVFGRSEVRAAPGSVLAGALASAGGSLTVACHHHQAVDRVGDGLVVSARAADGVVEALEDPAHPFLLGVQWHPEIAEDAGLFRGLVEVARARR